MIEPGGAQPLPDPALVVLIGASGSGKSTWAQGRYRPQEIVSSDDLRGIVGSGRHDLDASTDAFALLDAIVAARVRRGLTCVVDTLGLDADRRRGFLAAAKAHRLPAVAVVFDGPEPMIRERNRRRDRPVPADVLASQLRRSALIAARTGRGGLGPHRPRAGGRRAGRRAGGPAASLRAEPERGLDFVLQLSRFTWGDGDPAEWLRGMALAADEAGFAGLALMDHLIQIPQVDRAWAPILEPWVTLGLLAGLDTRLCASAPSCRR